MKYAIANQQGIVYTIADTAKGFDPTKTKGETCIPIDNETEVKPHYKYDDALKTFAPRPMDDELLTEMHLNADAVAAEMKEKANQQARQDVLDMLIDDSQNKISSIKQKRDEAHATADKHAAELHEAINKASHYYELPRKLRFDK